MIRPMNGLLQRYPLQCNGILEVVTISRLEMIPDDFELISGDSALPHVFGRSSGPRKRISMSLGVLESYGDAPEDGVRGDVRKCPESAVPVRTSEDDVRKCPEIRAQT